MPDIQGSLDALCGFYAVVNSVRLLLHDRVDHRALFAALLAPFATGLAHIVWRGTTVGQFRRILRAADGYLRHQAIRLRWQPAGSDAGMSLTQLWHRLHRHAAAHGAGSIIVGLAGCYRHWSCATAVTPRRLTLADSVGLCRIERAYATVAVRPRALRRHVLLPHHSFLLSIER